MLTWLWLIVHEAFPWVIAQDMYSTKYNLSKRVAGQSHFNILTALIGEGDKLL